MPVGVLERDLAGDDEPPLPRRASESASGPKTLPLGNSSNPPSFLAPDDSSVEMDDRADDELEPDADAEGGKNESCELGTREMVNVRFCSGGG